MKGENINNTKNKSIVIVLPIFFAYIGLISSVFYIDQAYAYENKVVATPCAESTIIEDGIDEERTEDTGGSVSADITYTITFDPCGGEAEYTVATTGEAYTLDGLPHAGRLGYSFQGWFTDPVNGTRVTTKTIFESDATVYAHWEFSNYVICYDPNGGAVSPSVGVSKAEQLRLQYYGALPSPSREGYDFLGWFTEKAGGTRVDPDDRCYRDTTVYAHWEKILVQTGKGLGTGSIRTPEYRGGARSFVYFGSYDGEPVKYRVLDREATEYAGDTMFIDCDSVLLEKRFDPTSNTWASSELRNWLNGDSFLNSNTVFTNAERAAIVPSNGPELNDDKIFVLSKDEAQNARYGYQDVELKDMNWAKTGANTWWLRTDYYNDPDHAYAVLDDYIYFNNVIDDNVGVSPAFNINLSSIIFTSLISDNEYKLTIKDADLGIGTGTVTRRGNTVSVPYSITGKNADKATQVSVLITDKAYSAGKAATSGYAYLTLDVDSFGTTGTGTFTLPDKYSKKICKKDYYAYILAEDINDGKMTDYACAPIPITVPDLTYLIGFDPNGGSVSLTTETTGSGYKLTSLPTPTFSGHDFDGWYTAASGGTKVTTSTVFSADTTIYAHWKDTITFNPNGGTVNPKTAIAGSDGKLAALPTPAYEGYVFLGWFSSAFGGEQVTTETVFGSNTTIYAHWEKKFSQYVGVALGTGALNNPAYGSGGWNFVYFGTYDGQPVRYRVLDKTSTDFGGDTLLLDCDNVLLKSGFDDSDNTWNNSEIREWLNGRSFYGNDAVFNEAERSAIAASTKNSVSSNDGVGLSSLQYTSLSNDKIFVLDAKEATRSSYGFQSSDNNDNYRVKGNSQWWLRSADNSDAGRIGYINSSGALSSSDIDDCDIGVSPALNINLSSVIFSQRLSGDNYKLTIRDDDIKIETGTITREGTRITVPYTITGKNASKVKQLSVLIMDEEYSEGITATDGYIYNLCWDYSGTTGSAGFSLPSEFADKKCGKDYYVYLIAEDRVYSERPDYASTPLSITVPNAIYKVYFNPNGGNASSLSDMTKTDGTLNDLPVPSYPGHIFEGWYSAASGGTRVTTDTVFTANNIVYAHWKDTPAETITGLGTGTISNPIDGEGGWDYVYYGIYDGKPVKYRILDKTSTEFGSTAMLLDCDQVLTKRPFSIDGSNAWAGSEIKYWLNGDEFLNNNDVFTVGERRAIVESNKDVLSENDGPGFSILQYAPLDRDRVFLLDAREATRSSYGYSKTCSIKQSANNSGDWFLRSPSNSSTDKVGAIVSSSKSCVGYQVRDTCGICPAFNINLSDVIYSSLVTGVSGQPGAEYKLTLLDDNITISVADGDTVTRCGNTVSVPYSLSGTDTNKVTNLSVLLLKKRYSAGATVINDGDSSEIPCFKYLHLKTEPVGATGIGTFTLPQEYLDKACGTDYFAYILAEDVNDGYETDYASLPNAISVPSSIKLKDGSSVSLIDNKLSYGQKLSDLRFKDTVFVTKDGSEEVISGSLAWKNPDSIPNVGDVTAEWVFIPDSSAYASLDGTVPIDVKKASITGATVSFGDSLVFTGSEQIQTVTKVMLGDTDITSDCVISGNKVINAGDYTLTITAKDDGNYTGSIRAGFTIAKASHADVTASGTKKYGAKGTVNLTNLIESGGRPGIVGVSDANCVLDSAPSVRGTVLNYSFANLAENIGKTANITIPVKDSTNYLDYNILVTLTVCACTHENTEIRSAKPATCIETGYTGDRYCLECGARLSMGSTIPIDPDNHAYDSGVITKHPTIISRGIKTLTCTRCHHSYTETLPRMEDGEDHSDLIKDISNTEGSLKGEIKTETKGNGNTETVFLVHNREMAKTVTDENGETVEDSKIWIGGLQSEYHYTGVAIKPVIHVYDGTRKLTPGTDYVVAYKNNKKVGSTATILVNFKGNYKGTSQIRVGFLITPAVLGEDIVAEDFAVAETGKSQKPIPRLKWVTTGKNVANKYFTYSYDRTVRDSGTYTVSISSKSSNYTGDMTAEITVTDKKLLLSRSRIVLTPSKYVYTGQAIVPRMGSYSLKLNGWTLTEGTDYVVRSVINNVDVGTATITFAAKEGNAIGYSGTKSATFKIVKGRELKQVEGFAYEYDASVPYAKGGAKPAVVIRDGAHALVSGKDYTLSYSKNSAVTNGATAIITVKGKGKYKGTIKKLFTINPQNIDNLAKSITVSDKIESKKGYKNPTVTICDLNGKKLKNGTDYRIGAEYTGPNTDGTVTVRIYGMGNYTGSSTISYRYIKATQAISKTKIMRSIPAQTYTGKEVRLKESLLTNLLYTDKGGSPQYLIPGEDFVVTKYSNSVKAGTAMFAIKGIGNYGGTKMLSFKICPPKREFAGTFVSGEWK